ncbi:MAG TPA: hypothetical protein VKD90_03190 [Gemmataceae bacterium]|nr:hypothetical protein [Gemmataceae bacterium]
MKTRLLACFVSLAVAPLAFGADEENPYKKVKVGDYATYKLSTKVAGNNLEGTLTQSVTAKTDKEVTIKITGKVNGMEIPGQEMKIDLTKPYDPTKAALPPGTEAKVEKLKDGTEKVKAAGKEYDCKWESYKVKAKTAGQEFEADAKAWMSKDMPHLLVKMEMTAEVMGMKVEMEMELSEAGSKSD